MSCSDREATFLGRRLPLCGVVILHLVCLSRFCCLVILGFPFSFILVICISVCGFSSFFSPVNCLSHHIPHTPTYHPYVPPHAHSTILSPYVIHSHYHISQSLSSASRTHAASEHKHTGGSTNSLGPISSRNSCVSHPSYASSRLIMHMSLQLPLLALRADASSIPVTTVI